MGGGGTSSTNMLMVFLRACCVPHPTLFGQLEATYRNKLGAHERRCRVLLRDHSPAERRKFYDQAWTGLEVCFSLSDPGCVCVCVCVFVHVAVRLLSTCAICRRLRSALSPDGMCAHLTLCVHCRMCTVRCCVVPQAQGHL